MTGDLPKFENPPAILQPAPRSAEELGVNLSERQASVHQVVNGSNSFRVRDAASPITVRNEGPMSAITMPPGWSELRPPSTPGMNVFRVKDGTTFVPPDHATNPIAQIHMGPGAPDRVSPQDEAAFRQLLFDKPAINGPQPVTPQEFQTIAGAIKPFNPPFRITEAGTVNINGKIGLLVRADGPGVAHEALYFDNSPTRGPGCVEQLSMTAPRDQVQQYDRAFWFSANSIRW